MELGEGGKWGENRGICNSVNNNKITVLDFISNKGDISSFCGDILGSCTLSAFCCMLSKAPSGFSKNLLFLFWFVKSKMRHCKCLSHYCVPRSRTASYSLEAERIIDEERGYWRNGSCFVYLSYI